MSLKANAAKALVCSITAVLAIVFNIDDALSVSEPGLRHIANEEGCRAQAYQCSANTWTLGLGHTQEVKQGDTATNEQIAHDFVKDVASAESVVKKHLTQTPSQAEYDMMVSFVFNLGAGNFARSTLLKTFNQGDHRGACLQYPRWVYVNKKDCRIKGSGCEGIPKRRDKEMAICLNGWQ
ncbi:lysozyme [Vibrio sp. 10N.261.45.A4]|uniref:lysozyme n=1 Tax=Vibrio TaxID=662 RepID=UPI0006358F8E|nr:MULTISPECIES: lysozyme [Vibrio]MCC4888015.1 lysozyme [Vibrio sp. F13]CDT71937.1 Lysozyme [Vibrio coralliirubri]